jgi:predicted acylesterase/phospholipase RssA
MAEQSPIPPAAGRLGLALSGGGFRAAFFHLGVLAQMARLRLLHQVEVISAVSGGSVIGALYYLHARRLLQSAPDAEITPDHYVRLVDDMSAAFLAAVQRNIRVRAFLNPVKNFVMSVDPRYSRSDRIGELYERYLYRPVVGDGSLQLRHLKIQPPDGPPDYYPRAHNAARTNKVPMLIINATALNTGRNWRFEVVRMGEPPRDAAIERDIDRTPRLCRAGSYADITEEQGDFALGTAVAASTGVPGMFPPLAVSSLYPDTRVELVDGGVHDNLGVAGLLDLDCGRFVVSDAGGQLEFLREPSGGTLGVLLRSNSILFNRTREEQLFRFVERGAPHAFVHLRRGLAAPVIPYVAKDGGLAEDDCRAPVADSSTAFGVDEDVQARLARVRTDLDSFSDVEAYTLAYDGYRMCEQPLRQLPGSGSGGAVPNWRFLAIASRASEPDKAYLRRLEVARHRFAKPLRIRPALAVVSLLVVVALVAGLILLAWDVALPRLPLGPVIVVVLAVAGMLAADLRNQALLVVRDVAALLIGVVRGVALALLAPVLWMHLRIFDRLFLRDGRVTESERTS